VATLMEMEDGGGGYGRFIFGDLVVNLRSCAGLYQFGLFYFRLVQFLYLLLTVVDSY